MSTQVGIVDHDAEMERIEGMLDGPSDARTVLRSFLGTSGPVSADDAACAYATLRSCVGRLLRSSAERDVLASWHQLLTSVQARLRTSAPQHAAGLSTLAELVFERAGMAASRRPEDLPRGADTIAMLTALVAAGTAGATVRELERATGRRPGSFDRIAVLARDSGVVDVVCTRGAAILKPRTEILVHSQPTRIEKP